MDCERFCALLTNADTTDLSPQDEVTMREHLRACSDCASLEVGQRKALAALRKFFSVSTTSSDNAIIDAMLQTTGLQASPSLPRRVWVWPMMAAACLLFALSWVLFPGASLHRNEDVQSHSKMRAALQDIELLHVYEVDGQALAVVQDHKMGSLSLWVVGDRVGDNIVKTIQQNRLTLQGGSGQFHTLQKQSLQVDHFNIGGDMPVLYQAWQADRFTVSQLHSLQAMARGLDVGAIALWNRIEQSRPDWVVANMDTSTGLVQTNAIKQLLAMASDHNHAARVHILSGLRDYPYPQILFLLQRIALDPQDKDRAVAARSLVDICEQESLPVLQVLVVDVSLPDSLRQHLQTKIKDLQAQQVSELKKDQR